MFRKTLLMLCVTAALHAIPERAQEILDYWFGDLQSETDYPFEKQGVWFSKNAETDTYIRETFERAS